MGQSFTPGLKALSSTTLRRIRELPVKGEILVKIGDKVNASTVVARAHLPGDLSILRIPEKMGIEPFEVMKGLKAREGEEVIEGQLLCEHAGLFGLFKTRFTSPVSGTVEFVAQRTGHVGIRMSSKPIELDAYIDGIVVEIDPKKSVTIESNVAFLQGIFGVGGERRGPLKLLSIPTSKEVEASDIPSEIRGAVLVGGMKPSLEALNLARERGAVGFVTGSVDDRSLAGYLGFDLGIALTGDEPVTMSIIITEGFGKMPMSERAITLLKKFDGDPVSINGATQVRAGALRPEIIACLKGSALENREGAERGLSVGSKIRIIRVPYFGKIAEVTELPEHLQIIPTGAEARVLHAKLESGEKVVVPRANVELL